MSINYKIISIDTATVTMVIQFEGARPLNFKAPTYNGAWLSGTALDAWILNMHGATYDEAMALQTHGNLTGAEAVQAILDPTGFNVDHLPLDPNVLAPIAE